MVLATDFAAEAVRSAALEAFWRDFAANKDDRAFVSPRFTEDIFQASRFMAWHDTNRGDLRTNSVGTRATVGNVYHYSLSWEQGALVDPKTYAALHFARHGVD